MKSLPLKSPIEFDEFVRAFVTERRFKWTGVLSRPGMLKTETFRKYAPDQATLEDRERRAARSEARPVNEVDPDSIGSIVIKSNTTHINLYLHMFLACADFHSIAAAKLAIEKKNIEIEKANLTRKKQLPTFPTDQFDLILSRGRHTSDFLLNVHSPIPGVIIDDSSNMHMKRECMDFLLDATNTVDVRHPTYGSMSNMLSKVGWLHSFEFSGWMATLTNSYGDEQKRFAGLRDRGPLVTLDYSNIVIHEYWETIGLLDDIDREVFQFVGKHLHTFADHSFRAYGTIADYIRSKLSNWKELDLRQLTEIPAELPLKERGFAAMRYVQGNPEIKTANEKKKVWLEMRGAANGYDDVQDVDRCSSYDRCLKAWQEAGMPGRDWAASSVTGEPVEDRPVKELDTPEQHDLDAAPKPPVHSVYRKPILTMPPAPVPIVQVPATHVEPVEALGPAPEPIVQADEPATPPEQAEPIVQADEPATPPEQVDEKPQWVHAAQVAATPVEPVQDVATPVEPVQDAGKSPKKVLDGSSTPLWLFDQLNDEVEEITGRGFDLDAAASDWNHKCSNYFDEATDSLQQDWSVFGPIWLNPPFSAALIGRFVEKAIEAAAKGSTVALLLPNWPGYDWYQEIKKSGLMRDIVGPVSFDHHDGGRAVLNRGRNSVGLVVALLGPQFAAGTNGPPIRKPKKSTIKVEPVLVDPAASKPPVQVDETPTPPQDEMPVQPVASLIPQEHWSEEERAERNVIPPMISTVPATDAVEPGQDLANTATPVEQIEPVVEDAAFVQEVAETASQKQTVQDEAAPAPPHSGQVSTEGSSIEVVPNVSTPETAPTPRKSRNAAAKGQLPSAGHLMPPYFGLDPKLVAPKDLVPWKSTLVQITQEVAKAGSFQAWESDPENRALVEWYVIQLVKQEKKRKLLASKKSGEPAIT
jgi:phage N-6-adenine-methyltransferase